MSESRLERSHHSSSTATGSGGTAAVEIAGATNGYGFRSTHGDALSIEMTFLNPRRRFPLADEFLPRVQVSSTQVKQLKVVCEEMITNALNKTGLFVWDGTSNQMVGGAKPWKQHYSKQNLTLYRRRKEASGDATLRHFVARGQVHSMNLQDVEYGMYCDTTVDERAVMTDLYRDLFLDAAVLKVYESQTEEDPFHFFGIKWLAHVSPADKFVSPRDYAFVEYSKRIVNKLGEPFLVKVVHSLPTDNVAAMNQREFDLIRGVLSCTYIYRYDAPTKNVQVFAEGHIDPCGKAPGWLSKSFLTKFAPTIVNLEHSADVKYIMRNNLVLTYDVFKERVASQGKKKKQCATCLKSFGMMARNYSRCRACAETVCSHCLMSLTLCIPNHEKRNAEHPSAVIQEKFCLKCLYTGRLDRNGKYMLEPYESRSQFSGSLTGEDEDFLSSKLTQTTMDASDDEAFTTTDDEIVSEQDRVRKLRLRHLAREKRKNMEQRHAPRTLYNAGPELGSRHGYNSTQLTREQADMTAFHEMQNSIAQQNALIRSIQSERAKLAQGGVGPPPRSQHHARIMRNSSSKWRSGGDDESRFTHLDDDEYDAPMKFKSSMHTPSTRTTMSSTSDSVGSISWD